MLNLIKYELRKTRAVKLGIIGISLLSEVLFLYGLYANRDDYLAAGLTLLPTLGMLSTVIIGLQSLITLHRDMNTKQGYMLFMTPNSSFKILGAKMLELTLSLFLMLAYFLFLGLADVTLTLQHNGTLQQGLMIARQVLSQLGMELQLNFGQIALLVTTFACSWLFMVTSCAFADVTTSALLNGKKWNLVLVFIIFSVISVLYSAGISYLPDTITLHTEFRIISAISLTGAVVLYTATAGIMQKYLSV